MTVKPPLPARLTVTIKIEVDLRDLPPNTSLKKIKSELDNMKNLAQELKVEMEADFKSDPEMAARTKVSVEVETHD